MRIVLSMMCVLLIFSITVVHCDDFERGIIASGNIPLDDSIHDGLNGVNVTDEFGYSFYYGPCLLNLIYPRYGASWMWWGYTPNNNNVYSNNYLWGIGFDSVLHALTQTGWDMINEEIPEVCQYRETYSFVKYWTPTGVLFYATINPSWKPDPGLLFPNEQLYKMNQEIPMWYDYYLSRRTDNGWYHKVFDHPGITTEFFWPNANFNYADVGVKYNNFSVYFYDESSEITPPVNFNTKVLLRCDDSCASGFTGNTDIQPGEIDPIYNWPAPPTGINWPQ